MIDNYKDFLKYLDTIKTKEKLLLHSCCAPCSTWVIEKLMNYFDLTIYYTNDNIYPLEEYNKRLVEQIKFASLNNIEVIHDYNDKDFYECVKGYESCLEGEMRCYKCYYLRLEKTAKKALELGFKYFSTTLSISPHKNSTWINEIGYDLESIYNINFLYSNFKKQEGYKKSVMLAKELQMYRQDYCGCVFSKNSRGDI